MHRALVLCLVVACSTRHYVIDPHTEGGQRTVACMEKCSPSMFDECTDSCHVDVRSTCGEVAPGLECKPTRQRGWPLQGALVVAIAVMAIGGVVGFVVAE